LELAAAGAANDRVVVRDAIASMREQSQSAKRELPVGKQWLAKISQAFSRFS
jgi:dihydroxyacetone kinase